MMSILKINKEMIPCKIMYLLFGCITGTFSPYLHVFLESLGFKSDHAGFLTGIRFVLSSLANPVWGYIADQTGRRKLVLFLLCTGSAVLVFPQPWVARSLKHGIANNHSRAVNITLLSINGINTVENVLPFSNNEREGYEDFRRPLRESGYSVLYYAMLGISSLAAIFIIPLPGYLDTIAVNVINGPSGQGATYGGQRIFGDVGFSIANYAAGLASDHYDYEGMSQYTPVFYMVMVYIVLTVPVGCYLITASEKDTKKKEAQKNQVPDKVIEHDNITGIGNKDHNESPRNKSKSQEIHENDIDQDDNCKVELGGKEIITDSEKKMSREPNTIKGSQSPEKPTSTSSKDQNEEKKIGVRPVLWEMMKNPDIIFFLCTVIISGVAWNTYNFFTLLLISHVTPSTKAKMSLALVLGSLSNIVCFPLSSQMIKLLGGPSQGIIVGLLSYFVRYMVMAYTNIFEVMIAIQLLHGLCFALSWSAMIEHTQKIAPQQIILTVFMLLSSIHFGICGLIANIVGGTVFNVYGGRALFGAVALLCAIWAAVMATYCCVKYIKKRDFRSRGEGNQGFSLDTNQPMERENIDCMVSVLKGTSSNQNAGGGLDVLSVVEVMNERLETLDTKDVNIKQGVGNEGYCQEGEFYNVAIDADLPL